MLDVGGGSTELIRRLPEGGIESVSLPLGASRGTEHVDHVRSPVGRGRWTRSSAEALAS